MPNYPNLYRNINQVYKDTKSNIEGLSGVNPGSIAFATDTNEWGFYNNSKWIWTANSPQADAIIRANSSGKINLNFIPDTLTGKDADTLDGQHGSYYRNADTLDGQHGSYYTNADNIFWGTQSISNLLSYSPSVTVRDHFTTSTISSYWDGWADDDGFFGGAPGFSINYNRIGHWLDAVVSSSQANKICYLYKSVPYVPIPIETQLVVDATTVEGGLMFWESNTKYIQLYIKGGVGTYSSYEAALFKKTVDGGTTTETQLSSTFPGSMIFKLRIYLTDTVCYGYASPSYTTTARITNIARPTNFSPTRMGLFITNRSTTQPRFAQFNYFGA